MDNFFGSGNKQRINKCNKTATLMKTTVPPMSQFSSKLPSHPPGSNWPSQHNHLSATCRPHPSPFPFPILESSPLHFLHYCVHSHLFMPISHKVRYASVVRTLRIEHKVGEAGTFPLLFLWLSHQAQKAGVKKNLLVTSSQEWQPS